MTAHPLLSTDTPKVALLGRPNVGKSTLFNRLIRSKRAITHDLPGVTRDRMEGVVKRASGARFIIVDTGGVTLNAHAVAVEGPSLLRGFEREILEQAKAAVQEADLLCLVVDGRAGLTPLDAHLADFLRRAGKPLLLVVNKVDGPEKADLLMAEFHGLGFDIIPCSAEHGFNVRELLDRMADALPDLPGEDADATDDEPGEDLDKPADWENATDDLEEVQPQGLAEPAEQAEPGRESGGAMAPAEPDGPLRLAMLGRPNAGKSSLVNALTRQQRMIVSEVPGTTRDSVDVPVEIDGVDCVFVDSAGVRRRSKITNTVERFSVNSALKTSSKAQVTLLVLDGQEGLTQQDKRLLELLDGRKIPFIVLVNKCDLMKPQDIKDIERTYRQELAYCQHIPLLMVSAASKQNLRKIIPLARSILAESRFRAGTGRLNRILEELLQKRLPPLVKQRRAKVYYMTQAETSPPTFVFFVSDLERIPDSYSRYLERSLRKLLALAHTPIRINFRQAK
ncbi:MAG: ribosome biogenesis GTPase Der [Deltaproteobacteria bacterium]|jgi:GTP-binding protein|nr:ribosome biogenesis GTPase Der [Deltaproteobacteria bacterium]